MINPGRKLAQLLLQGPETYGELKRKQTVKQQVTGDCRSFFPTPRSLPDSLVPTDVPVFVRRQQICQVVLSEMWRFLIHLISRPATGSNCLIFGSCF